MADIVVVGAVNVDLVVTAPRLPGPGETVVGDGSTRCRRCSSWARC